LFAQLSSLFGKKSNYPAEYKRFKKGMERNPGDHDLKTQFIKFCLLNRFTKHEVMENHITEALELFAGVENTDTLDLQCHYLVGKYYQENKDFRKAYQIYLTAIKRFNQYVGKNPDHKSDNAELAYSISLNLMTLQSNPIDPEVEKCFKLIHKSYPLHVKRIEFENEMAKPAPDKGRLKQLVDEIRKLKTEDEKESSTSTNEKSANPSVPKLVEKEDVFSKLFRVPTLFPKDLSGLPKTDIQTPQTRPEKEEKKDFFKLTPISQFSDQSTTFMIFQNGDWEGPFTLSQLRSMGSLKPTTWVCRVGSELVSQAYEVPVLHHLIQ
jgi:hypothetical protein